MIVSADGEIEDPVGAVNQSSFKSLCKSHFAFLLEVRAEKMRKDYRLRLVIVRLKMGFY